MRTELTRMLGGALARTVSDAGAFGMLGFDEGETAESLAGQLAMLRAGNAPVRFGISLVRWALDLRPELVDLAIAAKPRSSRSFLAIPRHTWNAFTTRAPRRASRVVPTNWPLTNLRRGFSLRLQIVAA